MNKLNTLYYNLVIIESAFSADILLRFERKGRGVLENRPTTGLDSRGRGRVCSKTDQQLAGINWELPRIATWRHLVYRAGSVFSVALGCQLLTAVLLQKADLKRHFAPGSVL
jgi:hypothetical protein